MCRLLQAASLAVVGLYAIALPAPCRDNSQPNDIDVVLVSGEVLTVQNLPTGLARATIKIVDVYCGPKFLKGLALLDHSADAGSNANGPIYKVGEEGIWLMGIDQNTDTLYVVGRYRKDHTPNYVRRVEWAAALGRMYKLEVPKRLKLAQELCGHKTPEVAQLGVEVLFGAKSDDAKIADVAGFLRELPKNLDVTPSALVRADRLWFERDGKQWIGSDRRKVLLDRLTEPLTEMDAVEVANHVVTTRYRQSQDGTWLTAREATALFAKIATDPRQSKAVRSIVVNRVVEVANNAGVQPEFTFDILAAVVRRGADEASRLVAAKGIARFKWGTPAQIEVLRALLTSEKDAEVKQELQSALDKAK